MDNGKGQARGQMQLAFGGPWFASFRAIKGHRAKDGRNSDTLKRHAQKA
jgi:hypothetical protein